VRGAWGARTPRRDASQERQCTKGYDHLEKKGIVHYDDQPKGDFQGRVGERGSPPCVPRTPRAESVAISAIDVMVGKLRQMVRCSA
jgi:hypothetical protein